MSARGEANSGDARILDRGHRAYDGPLTGTSGAILSVIRATVQRALGLHRGAMAKITPVLIVLVTFVPAIGYVAVAVLASELISDEIGVNVDGELVPEFAAFYGTIVFGIALFSTIVAPDVLCSDRRSRLLGLYLAAPLTRGTYLAAKASGVALVLSIVTLGPPLLYLAGLTAAELGPDGFVNWITTLGRIIASGVAVALLHTSLSLAVASLTDRTRVASASIAAILIGSSALAGALVEGAGLSDMLNLVDLNGLPFLVVQVIFGERLEFDIPAWSVVLTWAGLCAAFTATVLWNYRRLDVTK